MSRRRLWIKAGAFVVVLAVRVSLVALRSDRRPDNSARSPNDFSRANFQTPILSLTLVQNPGVVSWQFCRLDGTVPLG